jgi:hypothetical protein
MVAVGLLLVLVGFALVVSRGGMPGSASNRQVRLGFAKVFTTAGPTGVPSLKYRVIQVLMGLVVMAGGMLLIAMSS